MSAEIEGMRSATVRLDGEPLLLRELVARDLLAVWGLLEKAERTGDMTDAYLRVVLAGTYWPNGEPRWSKLDEIAVLPARVVVDLAERILAMSEVGMAEGPEENPPPAPKAVSGNSR